MRKKALPEADSGGAFPLQADDIGNRKNREDFQTVFVYRNEVTSGFKQGEQIARGEGIGVRLR